MGKLGPIATGLAATAFLVSPTNADEIDVVDNVDTAHQVAEYLTANCATTTEEVGIEEKQKCVSGGLTIANTLNDNFITYIKKHATGHEADTAINELGSCTSALDAYQNRSFTTGDAMMTAGGQAIASCTASFKVAGEAVNISYNPTAVATLENFANGLQDKPVITADPLIPLAETPELLACTTELAENAETYSTRVIDALKKKTDDPLEQTTINLYSIDLSFACGDVKPTLKGISQCLNAAAQFEDEVFEGAQETRALTDMRERYSALHGGSCKASTFTYN